MEERLKPESVAKMHEIMAQMSPEEAQEFRENLESLGRDARRMKAEAKKKKAEASGAGGRAAADAEGEGAPPNDVTPETARAVMEELLTVLRSESGKSALEKARSTVGMSAEAGMEAQGRKALEAVDEIARPILVKHGLEGGGLLAAMAAFSDTAKHTRDLSLARLMAELGELVTGRPVQSKAGRVPALDDLAIAWLSESEDARRTKLAKAEALLESIGPEAGPAAEEYVVAMRGLIEDAEDFVLERMVGIISELGDLDEDQKALSKARLNVLDVFMPPDGDARLKERVKEVALARGAKGRRRKRRRKKEAPLHTEL